MRVRPLSPQVQSSKGETDVNKLPPSILHLAFASLHVGLTHVDANGEIMVSTPEFTGIQSGLNQMRLSIKSRFLPFVRFSFFFTLDSIKQRI